MLELPHVSLACIDCEHHALALAALEQSMVRCRFADVLFYTDRALAIDELKVIPVGRATTPAERLDVLIRQLPEHAATSHVLLVQWDAFAVNAAAWDDAFLSYDYVAPRADRRDAVVANEGIALMSVKMLRALGGGTARDRSLDDAIERLAHQSAGAAAPIRIAPAAIANRFAFADDPPSGQPFGFQGLYNMWMLFQPADLDMFLQMATPDVLRSDALAALGLNLRELERHDEARSVFAAILRENPAHALAGSFVSPPQPAPQLAAGQGRAVVGRNDPCPCGSGRRYKACHGALQGAPGGAGPAAPPPAAQAPPGAEQPTQESTPPDHAARGRVAVLFNRAQTAFGRGDMAAAGRLYGTILAERPDDPIATEYLGVIATKARRHDEAERLLLRALALDAAAPEFHNNLGLLRHQQGEFDRAAECYEKALALAPDYAPAHNNLGLSHQESGRLHAAIACFRTASQLQPDFAEAHWNLGLALVLSGEFDEGLREHEWRLKVAQHRSWWDRRRQFPDWQGEPLEGKRILVLAEQGMGDMIQFVRYAEMLVARGATVVVEAAPELVDLLSTVPGVSEIVPRDGPYPRCDVQVPVMSLPLRFGTRPDTIPSRLRYLSADPARIERWRGLLGPRDRPRIGIAWAGNPDQARDRYRSMALGLFAPLLANPAYEWLGLQKGPAASQIAQLPAECAIRDMGRYSDTFADLAALVELLDLVISIDTSVVHVAGALGKPTLLLLDAGHDWRWPNSGSEGRWYPSVRIVRQPARGDWAGAIRLAASEISRLVPPPSEPNMESGAR